MLERPITSLILEGSILTARRTDTEGRPSIFLSVIGRPEDDRSLWSVRASEERYRKLIQYLPIPLLQVDAREIGGVFSELKLEGIADRSEEHTSELQSLMRTSYAVFCLKKNKSETRL